MKKLLFLIILLVNVLIAVAQNANESDFISITSFRALPKDMDARIQAPIEDQNGEKCALIKVVTTALGVKFEAPALGIIKQEISSKGEVWVYVPAGSRTISIFHEGVKPIRNYTYPINIESATVYEMSLDSNIKEDPTSDIIYDEKKFATLNFAIQPPNAQVILRKIPEQTDAQGHLSKQMPLGKYHYSVTAEDYYDQEGVVELSNEGSNTPINVNLKKHTGFINVSSTHDGATIFIDGQEIGISPLVMPWQASIGNHKVKVALKGYKTEEQEVIVSRDMTAEVKFSLKNAATYTFNTSPTGATVFIDGKEIGKTPCNYDGFTSDYDIRITHKKYREFNQKMQLKASEPNVNFTLERIYMQENGGYVQIGAKIGSLSEVFVSVGGYLKRINIEASYGIGLKKSEMIYWNAKTTNESPCGYTYKANSMDGKIGYGIIFGTRMRLTPQLGVGVVNITSAETYNANSSFDASKAFAVNASIGGKFEYAFVNCVGVFVSPEFSFAVKKSDCYSDLEPISSTIKGYATGLNIRAGLSLFF